MSVFVGDGTTGVEARADRLGLPTGTTDPATAEAGDMFYNTDTSKIRVYDGTAWGDLASGGGGGGGAAAYTIDNSVRFDASSSSHFSKAFSSAGNRRTWTWSAWAKRGKQDNQMLFASFADNSNRFYIAYYPSYILCFGRVGGVDSLEIQTNALYRDSSAWYHIVVSMDTTQSTESDRFKIYINGISQDLTVTTAPGPSVEAHINTASTHRIGSYDGSTNFFDGYLADVNFIDGSALAPTAFGEFDATTGVWNPIEYTGTYPGNSFHLDMSTTDVGKDASGNNNDWNISENIATLTGAFSSALTSGGLKTVTAGFTKPFNVGRSEGTGGLTFTPPTPIPYTTSVEVYDNNNVTRSQVNSGSFVQHAPNAWVTVASGSGTINSMFFQRTDNNAFDAGFYAIRVDGQVLYDSNQSDYFVDSPTNGTASTGGDPGGSVVGNYATLNPLKSEGLGTFSNGNLDFVQTTAGNETLISTISLSNGLWYWEVTLNSSTNNTPGIAPISEVSYPGAGSGFGWGCSAGDQYINGSTASAPTATTGDVIGFAFNSSTYQLKVYKNGVEVTFSPVTVTSGLEYFAAFGTTTGNSAAATFNFGQRPFVYPAPAGYLSLNTANLPTPSILNGNEYFDVVTYSGTNATNTKTLGFGPDLLWFKSRSDALSHQIFDFVRGSTKALFSDSDTGDGTVTDRLTSFNTDGFTLGADANNRVNGTGKTYVAWAWDAGDSNTNVTVGSLNSSAYNTSDTWSDDLSSPQGSYGGSSVTSAFDGSLTNGFEAGNPSGGFSTIRFQPASAITVNSSIRIHVFDLNNSDVTYEYRVNDGSWTSMPGTSSPYRRWQDLGFTGTLNSFEYRSNTSTTYKPTLYAVEIDGGLLIDSGTDLSSFAQVPSIASTVRANPSAGFSIVTYTGNGTAGATVGHGLGVAPKMVIVKVRSGSQTYPSWYVRHESMLSNHNNRLELNASTNNTISDFFNGGIANLTSSTTFGFNAGTQGNANNVNTNGNTYVAYCFTPIESYSAFGSYVGNTTDFPFVYLGFRAKWLLVKSLSAGHWTLIDTTRSDYNVADNALYADLDLAEDPNDVDRQFDILSNGFKLRQGTSGQTNGNGVTYLYAAFAENPFILARAR